MIGVFVIATRFYLHKKFLERLRINHAKLYDDLGEPKVFTKYPLSTKLIVRDLCHNNSLKRYTEFMAMKQWEVLNDSELKRYAKYRRYLLYLLGALCIVAVICTATKP